MKIVLNIVGVLFSLTGLVWTLQGANILPGSMMSGQTFWLMAGLISLVIGIGLLVFVNRRRTTPPSA